MNTSNQEGLYVIGAVGVRNLTLYSAKLRDQSLWKVDAKVLLFSEK